MQELIRFDEMGEDVYYILEFDGKVLNATKVEPINQESNDFDLKRLKSERNIPFYIQYRFIERMIDYLCGVTETYIATYPPRARKSDRYRMILTRCPDEWMEEDEIREWLG